MKPRRIPSSPPATDIFDRAIQEQALAVLTLQDGHQWHTFKARFLERDPRARFFVLDHQPVDPQRPLPDVAPGQYVGMSFRQRSRKFLFATVVEAKGQFVLDNRHTIPAVRYRWPDSMTELQRRAYFRTPVPAALTLEAKLWGGGSAALGQSEHARPEIVGGRLVDLSCGGALIRLESREFPPWVEGETLGLELQLPDERPPICVDVRWRGARCGNDGETLAAVQFIGLELAVDGRIVLQRLAGSVQRLDRMGTAAAYRDPSRNFMK